MKRVSRVGDSAAALLRARLPTGDSVNYLMSRPGNATDWVAYWVFENGAGPPPSAADLVAQLVERERFLRVLQRRVADVPGGLGNPYWVTDTTPLPERLVVRDEPVEWSTVLAIMADTFVEPLDLHTGVWQLTAFTEVSGAPVAGAGSVTVVFGRLSHAILVGAQIEGLGRALFGADPDELRIAGLGGVVDRARPVASAMLGVARFPFEFARWLLTQRRARVAVRRATPPPLAATARERTALNSPGNGTDLAVRVIRPDLASARGKGITLTALGVTAVSLAVERYLRGLGHPCPDDLAAYVPVAITEHRETIGVNRITAIQANLYPAIADLAARAEAVYAGMRDARAAGHIPAMVGLEVGAAVPFRAYLTLLQRGRLGTRWGDISLWATSVTSVRVGGDTDLSFAGRPWAFGGHLVNVSTDAGLAHSFVGGKFGLTVTVIASAASVPDIDGYTTLLAEAFAEVTAALSTRDTTARDTAQSQSRDAGGPTPHAAPEATPAAPLARGSQ